MLQKQVYFFEAELFDKEYIVYLQPQIFN